MTGSIGNGLDGYSGVPEDDLEVLRAMVISGSDLTRPRLVEHFMYLPDERRAGACAAGLRAVGWQALIHEPESGYDTWLVLARDPERVLSAATVIDDGVFFAAFVAGLEGSYDGWEAEN